MSRITTHCVCQNLENHRDTDFKPYSISPKYSNRNETDTKSSELLSNNPDISNSQKSSHHNDCNLCTNYENIEHYISGSFRPHSCPTDNNDCFSRGQENKFFVNSLNCRPTQVEENSQHSKKFSGKCSKSLLRTEKSKFHDQIYVVKNSISGVGASQRLDTIHQGLNLYINNSGLPVISNLTPETLKKSNNDLFKATNAVIVDSLKKPACGLKYILFQKLSIMTNFIAKSKNKSSTLINRKKQLSEENLFKEIECQTKRSKSFQVMNAKDRQYSESASKRNSTTIKVKQRPRKIKETETSNSSTGSIDAHAGSPITIMTAANSNILGGITKPFSKNAFSKTKKNDTKNESRNNYTNPEMKEHYQKRSHHHHQKQRFDHVYIDRPPCCLSHQTYPCPNCFYPYQQSCHQIVYDQVCRPHCCTQSPIPAPLSSHHCYCFSHSQIMMHPYCTQSPSPCCCNQSHYYCPCSNIDQSNHCQYELRPRSTLCHSCQYKSNQRLGSETLDDNRHHCDQRAPEEHGFLKCRVGRPSSSNQSKSVSSSIPPPPPPPPSSLYSANENTDTNAHRSKYRRHHHHHKIGKVCENCDVVSPDGSTTNNVQNIIYSHLKDTVTCNVTKNDLDSSVIVPLDQSHSINTPCDNANKVIKHKSTKSHNTERDDKENDQENHHLLTSRRTEFDLEMQKGIFDRRSAEIVREKPASYKTYYLSKTPDTYKSKNDRRPKKHQYDRQRLSKHQGSTSIRENKFNDNDRYHHGDYEDSPEAGSFIYHPISSLLNSNSQVVIPRKVSSFNRQVTNQKEGGYERTELVRKAFQENMLSLKEVGWYWGPLSFIEAESLMENKANGTFLVRDSGHDTYFLSLTFRVRETTFHTRIEYSQGTFSFWSQPESHSATTIVEFIDKAVAHSQSGKFHYFLLTNVPGQPPMEVSLLYPLSRHQIVHSLKHLSRFVILSHIRKDHIAELSVPTALRAYLLEKQYYVSDLEEFIDLTADAHPLSYKPSILN